MTKPIASIVGYHNGYLIVQPVDGAAALPVGMALYAHPADVAELVEALQYVIRGVPDTWDGVTKAKEVLSKWEGK